MVAPARRAKAWGERGRVTTTNRSAGHPRSRVHLQRQPGGLWLVDDRDPSEPPRPARAASPARAALEPEHNRCRADAVGSGREAAGPFEEGLDVLDDRRPVGLTWGSARGPRPELDESADRADQRRLERLRAERDALRAQLRQATGLGAAPDDRVQRGARPGRRPEGDRRRPGPGSRDRSVARPSPVRARRDGSGVPLPNRSDHPVRWLLHQPT